MSALPDTEALAKLTEHLRYGCNLKQRDGERAANAIDALAAQRIADAARIAELEAALKPFADFVKQIDASPSARQTPDSFAIHSGLTTGDFRKARAALTRP